jgi:hypothetical protein
MSNNKYIDQEGKFLCTVKRPPNGWLDETPSGTPYIRIPCIVTEEGDQHRKEIVWRGYLSEKAKPRTVEALIKAFDWDGDWDDLDSFAGIEVIIVTEAEEWNGEQRIKAKWLNRLTDKAKQEVADRILSRMKEEDGQYQTTAAPAKAPSKADAAKAKAMSSKAASKDEEELADDDIPF